MAARLICSNPSGESLLIINSPRSLNIHKRCCGNPPDGHLDVVLGLEIPAPQNITLCRIETEQVPDCPERICPPAVGVPHRQQQPVRIIVMIGKLISAYAMNCGTGYMTIQGETQLETLMGSLDS